MLFRNLSCKKGEKNLKDSPHRRNREEGGIQCLLEKQASA